MLTCFNSYYSPSNSGESKDFWKKFQNLVWFWKKKFAKRCHGNIGQLLANFFLFCLFLKKKICQKVPWQHWATFGKFFSFKIKPNFCWSPQYSVGRSRTLLASPGYYCPTRSPPASQGVRWSPQESAGLPRSPLASPGHRWSFQDFAGLPRTLLASLGRCWHLEDVIVLPGVHQPLKESADIPRNLLASPGVHQPHQDAADIPRIPLVSPGRRWPLQDTAGISRMPLACPGRCWPPRSTPAFPWRSRHTQNAAGLIRRWLASLGGLLAFPTGLPFCYVIFFSFAIWLNLLV